MRRGNILEGIKAGFQAYMQGRQWASQLDTSKLQQEQMGLANQLLQKRTQDYMSPEQEAVFNREQMKKDAEAKVAMAEQLFERQWALTEKELRARNVVEQEIAKIKMEQMLKLDAEVFKRTGLHLAGLYAATGGGGTGTVEQGRIMKQTNDLLESVFGGEIPNDQIASIPIYSEVMDMIARGDIFRAGARARAWKALHPFEQGKEGGGTYGTHFLDPHLRGSYMGEGQRYYPTYTGSGVTPKGFDPDEYLTNMALSGATDEQLVRAAETMRAYIGSEAGPPVPKQELREMYQNRAFNKWRQEQAPELGREEAKREYRFRYTRPTTAKE